MSLNNSLNDGVNEARTDKCEGLLSGMCPAGKQSGPGRHQITELERNGQKRKTRLPCLVT